MAATIIRKMQGESISFDIPVYNSSGVLVTNIASAVFSYSGMNMAAPAEAPCTIVGGGRVQYEIPPADTLALDPGIYAFEVKMKSTTNQVEEPIEVGYFILAATQITTAL